nr:immunoglobulin heavy chain junction region [Mus musculus]
CAHDGYYAWFAYW